MLFKGESDVVHATLEPDEGEYLDHTAPSLRFKDRILALRIQKTQVRKVMAEIKNCTCKA